MKILNSQSLRWSSPYLFKDPFELDHYSQADFTPQGLVKGIIKEAIGMLFGPGEPSGKSNRLIAAISRWRDEDRFASEEEAAEVLKQLLGQIAQQQQRGIDHYISAWKTFASHARICCFSDKPTNIHAWQRFGGNHSGIALRFSCGDDTALPNPQRVSYSTTAPLITSLKEQVNICYGRMDIPSQDIFPNKLLIKNKENAMEREWRCIESEDSENDADEQLWYNNKKFSAPELKSVYFGLTCDIQHKESVIDLVKKKYYHTKVYQAEPSAGRYDIHFSLIGIR